MSKKRPTQGSWDDPSGTKAGEISTSKRVLLSLIIHHASFAKMAVWLLVCWGLMGAMGAMGANERIVPVNSSSHEINMSSSDLEGLVRTDSGMVKTTGMFGGPVKGKPVVSDSLKKYSKPHINVPKKINSANYKVVSDYELAHTVFHTPDVNQWDETLYEIDNVSSSDKDVQLNAFDATGTVLSSTEFVLPARGVHKGNLTDLFADYFSGSVGADSIKMFSVNTTDNEPGKLLTNVTYETKSLNEKSSVTFMDDTAYHAVNIPHIISPNEASSFWWQGIDVNNISTSTIDIGFMGNDGSTYIVAENVVPGADWTGLTTAFLGDEYTLTAGELQSFVSDEIEGEITGEPIDAITALSIYGPRMGYVASEGWNCAGSKIDGTNSYSKKWSIPTGTINKAAYLNHEDNNWMGIAFNDKSGKENTLKMTQYDIEGNPIKYVTAYINPNTKIAFLPENFEIDTTINGSIEFESSGEGDMIYLLGDEERSFMGGGKVASDISKYAEVSTAVNAGQSGVLSIMNPGDEYASVDVMVFNDAGTLLSTTKEDVLVAPHGTVNLDHSEYITNGWNGKLQLISDTPVLANLDEYTISENKNFVNMNGKAVKATVSDVAGYLFQFLVGKAEIITISYALLGVIGFNSL